MQGLRSCTRFRPPVPELPEVETVRRGLEPLVTGAMISAVTLNRPDLRFPFPPGLAARLTGQRIITTRRRAKYLLFDLSGGGVLLSHLGMTGNFRFGRNDPAEKHDHLVLTLSETSAAFPNLIYSDPRRFGFVDLVDDEPTSKWLSHLGPEPLGNQFDAFYLAAAFAGRAAPAKSLLLDQRVVAGLGNIYVSEALYRARVHPETAGYRLVKRNGAPADRLADLVIAVRQVLEDALASGGSTLQDYRTVDGATGYFQHRFAVYERAGEPCLAPRCAGTIQRIVQSGRSSFFCPKCQPRPRRLAAADKSR